ncbi:ABC exporter membrane fusion protein [Gloeocapsa sp. PCC 73106]|uniref:ABC exporter membrane fusion protein n=1 Tax=Gloeocapsa sp. PCC 73106 TaxID=102232 RepID=UPI0002ABC410|nr:ABC exporter membrane fusion protein [Gloeocapsa sp. PCC 73106]ELR97141.1 ABC exporter membrane fusion protein, DevB family [Gloeocapsa sp. PCC 73106]
MENTSIPVRKSAGRVIGALILCGGLVTVGLLWQSKSTTVVSPQIPTQETIITTVTALGRLEPHGRVIKLAAPTSSQENKVAQLLVEEGDLVKAGQVIAIMDSHDRALASLREAEAQIKVAQAKLAVIQAGAKEGEIEAQRAEIARLEAERQSELNAQSAVVTRVEQELQNAQTEYNRYQWLYEQGTISASQRDSEKLTLDTLQKSLQETQANLERIGSTKIEQLNQAKATLNQISEVRTVDIREAEAEIERANGVKLQAEANLAQTIVRSPIDAEVLYIHTRMGETVSTEGIVEIGQTQQMQVIAEVYQSDINKVYPGQKVRITSSAIPEELRGTVDRVGAQVRRQTVVNIDPSSNIDARVIEVEITLDSEDSQKAAKFTNLQVQVVIEQ